MTQRPPTTTSHQKTQNEYLPSSIWRCVAIYISVQRTIEQLHVTYYSSPYMYFDLCSLCIRHRMLFCECASERLSKIYIHNHPWMIYFLSDCDWRRCRLQRLVVNGNFIGFMSKLLAVSRRWKVKRLIKILIFWNKLYTYYRVKIFLSDVVGSNVWYPAEKGLRCTSWSLPATNSNSEQNIHFSRGSQDWDERKSMS